MTDYLLIFIPKEPQLTRVQLQTLIDMYIGVGLIGIGSSVIPILLNNDSISIFDFCIVLVLIIISWYSAMRIGGQIKNE